MRDILFIFLFSIEIFSLNAVQAQGIIKGYVTDSKGKALEYSSLRLLNIKDSSLAKGSITDDKGYFILNKVDFGHYLLKIDFVAFEQKRIKIELNKKNKHINLKEIKLKRNIIELDGVVVKGKVVSYKELVDRTIIKFDSIDIINKPTALRALKKIPGAIVDIQSGNVNILGEKNVLVLINGVKRPSVELKSIRTADIDSVEFITTPSSKYDSEYSSVINIIVKNKKTYGLSLDVFLNYYTKNIYNSSDAKIEYGFGKFKIYAYYDLYLNRVPKVYEINRKNETDTNNYEYSSKEEDNLRKNIRNYFNYGFDYFINDKNFLSFIADYNNYYSEIFTTLKADIYINDDFIESQILNRNKTFNKQAYNYSLFYKKKIKNQGQQITFISSYYNADMNTNQLNNGYIIDKSNVSQEYKIKNKLRYQKETMFFKIDYSHPFGKKFNFETGYHLYMRNFNDCYNDEKQIYNFIYQDAKHSSYIYLNSNYKKNNIAIGLRAEYLDLLIADSVPNNYIHFIPNISLQKNINNHNSVSLGYNRRLKYPRYLQLNPFIVTEDSLNVWQGNPYLKPNQQDNYNLNYSFKKNDFYIKSILYYNYSKNDIQYFFSLDDNNVKHRIFKNIGIHTKYGLKERASFPLFKILILNPAVNIFYENYKDETDTWKGLCYACSISPEIRLKNKLTFGASFYYKSKTTKFQGYEKRIPWISFFVTKSFFKNKGNIYIGLNPINYYYIYFYEGNGFYMKEKEIKKYKNIFIEFSYSFNQGKKIRKEKKETHLERDF